MNHYSSELIIQKRFTITSVCVAFCFIVWILLSPIQAVTFFLSDDAYYYLLTAKNIILGNGSSFDGFNLSNGYHPQWMLLLLPIYWVFDNAEHALRAVVCLQLLISLATVNLCFRWCYKRFGLEGALVSVLSIFIFNSPMVLMLNGLESAVLLFWLFFLLYLDDTHEFLSPDATLKNRLLFGLLLAGLASARLDVLFILMALAGLKLLWPGIGEGKSRVIHLITCYMPTIIAFLVALSPYFIWNYLTFGHLSPISGSIKNTFPHPISYNNIGLQAAPFLLPFALALIFTLYSIMNKSSYVYRNYIAKWDSNPSYMLLAAITFGCVLHILWTRLFMLFGIYQWHFVAYIPTIIIFAALLYNALKQKLQAFPSVVRFSPIALVLLFTIAYNSFLALEKGDHHASRLAAAAWVSDNLAKEDGVALSDAGVFGYFNQRTTLNLDGLINSYDFQQAILDDQLLPFFEAMGVKYIADAYTDCESKEHSIYVYAWRGKNFKQGIGYEAQVSSESAIYRSQPLLYRPLSEGRELCFSIWRLDDVHLRRFE